MGSPLGPLLANTFMCSIKEKLEQGNKLPSFYKWYVDDTFTFMPDLSNAKAFLNKLNSCHESLNFTMEIAEHDTIFFVGITLLNMETDLKHQYTESPQTPACSFTITVMWTNDTKGVYFSQWSTALIACHRLLPRFPRNVTSFELHLSKPGLSYKFDQFFD